MANCRLCKFYHNEKHLKKKTKQCAVTSVAGPEGRGKSHQERTGCSGEAGGKREKPVPKMCPPQRSARKSLWIPFCVELGFLSLNPTGLLGWVDLGGGGRCSHCEIFSCIPE